MLFIAPGLFNLEFDGMADNFVEISGLYFARNKRQIFKDVNLNVPRGKITAIMGPSGSGKTTLLRLISAQLHPQQGKVCVNGIDIHQLNRFDLYQTRGLMGMLFQSGALFTSLDVFENVAFPLREHTNLPEEIIRDVVLMQLEVVGLRGARRLMPSELSGGMSHRVALARSLVLNPKLMMYDEPFTGQDRSNKPRQRNRLFTIVTNSFYRATSKRLFTKGYLLCGTWLGFHIDTTTNVFFKKIHRNVNALTATNAVGIHIIFTTNILC